MHLYMQSNVSRSDHMTSRQLKLIPFIVYFYLTFQVLEFHFNQIRVRQEVYVTAAKATLIIGNVTLVLLCFYIRMVVKDLQVPADCRTSSVLDLVEHEYLLLLIDLLHIQIILIYLYNQ